MMFVFNRERYDQLVEWLGLATAASLPWSTSATGVLSAIWIVAIIPTIDRKSVRLSSTVPAAVLPVTLFAFAVLGMLWTDVAWFDRLRGVDPFIKLAVIPILFLYFSHKGRSDSFLLAFFYAACVLLALSWLSAIVPLPSWAAKQPGIPVKDYISQSAIFTLCAFALIDCGLTAWHEARTKALLQFCLAALFFADMVFVTTSRTSLVEILSLFALLGARRFSRRGMTVLAATIAALATAAWFASPYLQGRVTHALQEVQEHQERVYDTSAGTRLELWKNSLAIVRSAPIIGHGTGSTRVAFAQETGADIKTPEAATNPHNQIFAIAIPLGLVGAFLLIGTWVAHWRLFLVPGATAWIGLIVVTQNVVGSIFNSHLSDFTHGWIYVLGVGAAGGALLRVRQPIKAPIDGPVVAASAPS